MNVDTFSGFATQYASIFSTGTANAVQSGLSAIAGPLTAVVTLWIIIQGIFVMRGDISARSALTIHRGTANRSSEARPVLVVGVDAPDATNAAHHDLQVTRGYLETLPPRVRDHLTYRVVDRLETVVQHHVIEGLLESTY